MLIVMAMAASFEALSTMLPQMQLTKRKEKYSLQPEISSRGIALTAWKS